MSVQVKIMAVFVNMQNEYFNEGFVIFCQV